MTGSRSALAQRAAEVGGEEAERLLDAAALAPGEAARGALEREQHAARRQQAHAAAARQGAAQEEQVAFGLHALLFERLPALERAGPAVVHHDRLRLEQEPPARALDAQAPLVVLAVHV